LLGLAKHKKRKIIDIQKALLESRFEPVSKATNTSAFEICKLALHRL